MARPPPRERIRRYPWRLGTYRRFRFPPIVAGSGRTAGPTRWGDPKPNVFSRSGVASRPAREPGAGEKKDTAFWPFRRAIRRDFGPIVPARCGQEAPQVRPNDTSLASYAPLPVGHQLHPDGASDKFWVAGVWF